MRNADNKIQSRIPILLLAIITLFSAGCLGKSAPSNFYLLSPISEESSSQIRSEPAKDKLILGIGPIEFPKYLDRPQIVTRSGPNRVYIAEFDQWAEPIEVNFTRTLAENLSALLKTDQVYFYPWRRDRMIDCQVMIDVIRFDSTTDGQAILSALWTLLSNNGDTVVTRKTTVIEPAKGQDYEAVVAASSRAVEKLSREIAVKIGSMSGQ